MLAVRAPQGQDSPLRRFLRGQAAAPVAELLAALAAATLYLPSLGFGFVFDDAALIRADGSPIALGGTLPYRPLRYASYLIDDWLGGSAIIYHAHNVLLHAVVSALVVAIARRLGAARVPALVAALVVACHPIAVEAVAYVAGRRDLLCVALGLAAVLVRLGGRSSAALVLLVAAAAAKESGLVFAAPLLAISLAQPAAGVVLGAGGVATAAGGAAVVAAAAAGLALAVAYGAIGPWHPPLDAAGLALPGKVAAHYLSGLAGLRAFSPEYPGLVASGGAPARVVAMGGTLLVLAAAALSLVACRRAGRNDRGAAVAIAWFASAFAALAVWGGLHEPGADRHAYLLLPAAAVAVSVAASRVWSRLRSSPSAMTFTGYGATLRMIASAAVVLAIASCARAASDQMQIWKSERALWSGAAVSPLATPRAHANLARALAMDGDYAAATTQMNAALAKDPDDPLLLLSRAAVRCAAGRRTLARRDLRHAARTGAASDRVAALAADCAAGAGLAS